MLHEEDIETLYATLRKNVVALVGNCQRLRITPFDPEGGMTNYTCSQRATRPAPCCRTERAL